MNGITVMLSYNLQKVNQKCAKMRKNEIIMGFVQKPRVVFGEAEV